MNLLWSLIQICNFIHFFSRAFIGSLLEPVLVNTKEDACLGHTGFLEEQRSESITTSSRVIVIVVMSSY